MLKLYGNGRSRWVKPYWLLRELDVPFEPVIVDAMRDETRTSTATCSPKPRKHVPTSTASAPAPAFPRELYG